MRECELCGSKRIDNTRFAKHVSCFRCIDKILEFAVSAGMRFEDESVTP